MRTNPNPKSHLGLVGRVSIALASAAIAATTLGAVSASAATVRPLPSNATTVNQQIPHLPLAGQYTAAVVAFPAGGKGSASESTCRHFTKIINQAEQSFTAAGNRGDAVGAGHAASQVASLTNGATDAGCAVINSPA